ncbi:recombinase family protein [Arenivirga flava]|uniref:Serine recombinase n=1 Tax=Arenivirga flava TaxID=1930060 RepID=A0AA37UCZ1_9MICO|nr:recombinase family protein [Arenivirga flava]GMA27049.1 serine recombinase [Arenivirga flava]
MTVPKLRAALYLRISKDDGRTGLAVERQREECLRVIEREGLELVGEPYVDNGVSAYNRNVTRPAFDAMTHDYERGKFDAVVCWDLDRFSRQPAQLEHWIEMGEARGLRIYSPSEITDLGTDNGRMFARMKATIARAEVERKSTRQKAQAAQAKALGTYKGRTGFDDAPVIRRMFALALAGSGPYEIAAKLNADGLTTARGIPWSGQAVKGVTRSQRHRGGLVTESDFDKVQDLLSAGVRVGPKARGLYSGIARCSTCSAAMTASGDRYKCSYAANHPGSTGHQTILRTVLESRIDAAMVDAIILGPESQEDSGEVAALDAELARIEQSRKKISRLVAADLLPEADAAADLRALKAEAESLTAQRTRAITTSVNRRLLDGLTVDVIFPGEPHAQSALRLREAVGRRWKALEGDERRKLAREYLGVTVQPRTAPERLRVRHLVVTDLNPADDA